MKLPSIRLHLRTGLVLVMLGAGLDSSRAQIGDVQDQPGVVQKSLVAKDQIPDAPVLSPEEALETFIVAPGYALELAAHEPQVQEPVAIAFSPDGRMWVAEMRGYMPDVDGSGEDEANGRIVFLEDRDGDGFYETSTVFIDELVMPRALLPVADGLLVGAPPELAYYRDTNGDGKADSKELVAIDYGVKVDPARPHLANPERAPNSLHWAYDNWIYSSAYSRRFRYRDGQWESGGTSFRGQWGLGQDPFGRLYYGSNSDYIRVDLIHSSYLARQRHDPSLGGTNVNAAVDQLVWPVRVTPGINRGYRPEMLREGRLKAFTAAGGQTIYGGDRLPGLTGDYFMPEPAANLVRRSILSFEDGTVRSENAYEESEFIASTDERFRPVNTATGPDGSLYVVDFYRGILQHRISLTSYLREQILDRGLDKGLHHGRIYRVVAADPQAPEPAVTPPPATPSGWVPHLAHPNEWWRQQAQRVLVEAADHSLAETVRKVASEDPAPIARVHALWTLEGMGEGALDLVTLTGALNSGDSVVQAHAIRLAEPWLEGGERDEVLEPVLNLLNGQSPEVRLQAVLSLGGLGDEGIEEHLAEVVRRHLEQPYLLDAFLSGLMDREAALLSRLIGKEGWEADEGPSNQVLAKLARAVQGSRDPEAVAGVVNLAGLALEKGQPRRAASLLQGLVPVAGFSRRPILLDAMPEAWPALSDNQTTKRVVDRLLDTVVWPGKEGVTVVTEPDPLSARQQELYDQGEIFYAVVCASCHQADGRGLDGLAPPLLDAEWVLGSEERLVRIVLHGVRGPIRVLGKTHTGDMPPLGILPDEQIAAVLTYVRRAWGHAAAPVEIETVSRIREESADHADAWSAEELMQIE